MFDFLERNCERCGGRLIDEWKLDLPGYAEIVCINCGNRFWEKMKGAPRYGRKKKRYRRKTGRRIYVKRKLEEKACV